MRIENKKADIGIDYANRSKAIEGKEFEFDQQKFDRIINRVGNKHNELNKSLSDMGSDNENRYQKMQEEVAKNIKDGSKTAKRSAFNLMPGATKPDFLKSEKKKK